MRLIKILDQYLEETVVVMMLTGMTLLVGFQVIMRYVMHDSLSWSEELSRYMFIWMINIGISYGVRTNRHISVDVLATILSKKKAAFLSVLADILFFIFSVTVIMYGIEVVQRIIRMGQSSPALEIPMAWVYSSLPIGFFLVSIRLLQSITRKVKCIHQGQFEQI